MTTDNTPLRERVAAVVYDRHRPFGVPWEYASDGARERYLASADAIVALLCAPAVRCDCGREMTQCSGCAVEDYCSTNLDCPRCCTPGDAEPHPGRARAAPAVAPEPQAICAFGGFEVYRVSESVADEDVWGAMESVLQVDERLAAEHPERGERERVKYCTCVSMTCEICGGHVGALADHPVATMAENVREMARDLSERGVNVNAPRPVAELAPGLLEAISEAAPPRELTEADVREFDRAMRAREQPISGEPEPTMDGDGSRVLHYPDAAEPAVISGRLSIPGGIMHERPDGSAIMHSANMTCIFCVVAPDPHVHPDEPTAR